MPSRHYVAAFPIFDIFWQSPCIAANHRDLHGLRLDDGIAEAFRDSPVEQDIRPRKLLSYLGGAQSSQEFDTSLQTELCRYESEGLQLIPPACNSVRATHPQVAQPGNRFKVVLVSLGPVQPADAENSERLVSMSNTCILSRITGTKVARVNGRRDQDPLFVRWAPPLLCCPP